MREGRGVTFAEGHVYGLKKTIEAVCQRDAGSMAVAHSEGGRADVDGGGATMTKNGTWIA
jgi:hypothetical protein